MQTQHLQISWSSKTLPEKKDQNRKKLSKLKDATWKVKKDAYI
jgi:hypothetical protein